MNLQILPRSRWHPPGRYFAGYQWALTLAFWAVSSPASGLRGEEATWISFDDTIVRAALNIEVSAVEAGTIERTLVTLNQPVDEECILLEFDSQEARLAVLQASDEHHRAEVMVEKAKAILVRAKQSAQRRRDDLERHRQLGESFSDAERRSLQEAVDNAEVEHVVAYNEYLQTQHLVEIGKIRSQAAELRLARMTVTAPFAGEITRVLVQPGERVEIGEPLLELRAMERMLAEFHVPEDTADLHALIGSSVEVDTLVAGKQYHLNGLVLSADSEVNARGAVRVHVEIYNERYDNRWVLFHGKRVNLRVRVDGSL